MDEWSIDCATKCSSEVSLSIEVGYHRACSAEKLYNDIKSAHKILFYNVIISSASESETLPNREPTSSTNPVLLFFRVKRSG